MARQILISQNIRGTPAMKAWQVRHDLKEIKLEHEPTILALQEMKWVWYWTVLMWVFPGNNWGKFPGKFKDAKSSQPILWDKRVWKKIATLQVLLHDGVGGMTEDRYINAVLLMERATGNFVWITNRHYLPAVQHANKGSLRWKTFYQGLRNDVRFLDEIMDKTKASVFAVGDFNWRGAIYKGTMIGEEANYLGWALPIDKVVVFQGEKYKVDVFWKNNISTDNLETDHGGKKVAFDLEEAA